MRRLAKEIKMNRFAQHKIKQAIGETFCDEMIRLSGGEKSKKKKKMTKGEIKKLQILCHEIAESKGFYDGYNNRATWLEQGEKEDKNAGLLLALMHSELSEALEAIRAKNPEDNNLGEEMADLVIRALDACEYWNIDLEHEILKKIEKNKVRPHKHGKKF